MLLVTISISLGEQIILAIMSHQGCRTCSLLHIYCYEKNYESIIETLSDGSTNVKVNVNAKGCHNRTPLMNLFKVWNGIEKEIKNLGKSILTLTTMLITHGANLNEKDEMGNTVLHIIANGIPCLKKSSVLIEASCLLVAKGADLSCINKKGESASEIAFKNNSCKFGILFLTQTRQLFNDKSVECINTENQNNEANETLTNEDSDKESSNGTCQNRTAGSSLIVFFSEIGVIGKKTEDD